MPARVMLFRFFFFSASLLLFASATLFFLMLLICCRFFLFAAVCPCFFDIRDIFVAASIACLTILMSTPISLFSRRYHAAYAFFMTMIFFFFATPAAAAFFLYAVAFSDFIPLIFHFDAHARIFRLPDVCLISCLFTMPP